MRAAGLYGPKGKKKTKKGNGTAKQQERIKDRRSRGGKKLSDGNDANY